MIEGLIISPQRIIGTPGGSVLKIMSVNDTGFVDFGEVYVSTIEYLSIKGWKQHSRMTLNLSVVSGRVRFVFFDDRPSSTTYNALQEVILDLDTYSRITVPPEIWFAFQGLSSNLSMVVNTADIVHDDLEVKKKDLDSIKYNWEI